MLQGKFYFDFKYIKEVFNLPEDALLKHIEANNNDGTVEFTFYTNETNEKLNNSNESNIRRYKPELN